MARPRGPLAALGVALGVMTCGSGVSAEDFPQWAYPGCAPPGAQRLQAAPPSADAARPEAVPGSRQRFTRAAIADWSVISDWFPDEHPTMPPVLASSADARKPACGYCHLPSGGGRPENANLAGLPAAYIVAQVHAFHAHERGGGAPVAPAADAPAAAGAAPVWPPSAFMARVSADVSDADLAAAAGYFARQRPTSRVTVIEGRSVPGYAPACFAYVPTGGRRVALGSRIVEMPTDVRRFELRDPHATFLAYVPPGSIGRGRQLARDGGGGRTPPCAGCHGVDLKGGGSLAGPPLAGRFTGYLFRQLVAFKSGARQGDAARPMRAVAAALTQRDMIDLAAYATSIPP